MNIHHLELFYYVAEHGGISAVEIVAIWRGEPTPLVRAVIEECQRYGRENWPELACSETLDSL